MELAESGPAGPQLYGHAVEPLQQGASAPRSSPPKPAVVASRSPPARAQTSSALPILQAVTVADLNLMAWRVFPGAGPTDCGDFAVCPATDRLRAG